MEAVPIGEPFSFDAVFHAYYERIARAIARIVRDPSRAEELAVDVFWKFWRNPRAHGENPAGWLYRAAIHTALNDLRRQTRASRREQMSDLLPASATPEQAHAAAEEQQQVRTVLASLDPRQSELLLLRHSGLSYDELAAALDLNPASVGTFLGRAQQAFRKEYISRYGEK
jgi:RNA polymerase sigma-70 factor, ECF subfamily